MVNASPLLFKMMMTNFFSERLPFFFTFSFFLVIPSAFEFGR